MDLQLQLQLDTWRQVYGTKQKIYWNFGEIMLEISYSMLCNVQVDTPLPLSFHLSQILLTTFLPLHCYVYLKSK